MTDAQRLDGPFSLIWREDLYRERAAAATDISDHLPFLLNCATARPVIVELGVRQGNSTAALLLGAHWSKGHVYSIDINPPDVDLIWHQDPRWSFAQCDSISAQALAFAPPVIDLLFVDTSHDQAQTLAECRAWMPRVRRDGGIALFHDTQWDHGDVSLPTPAGPVAIALDHYCQVDHAGTIRWYNRDSPPGLYGLGVIEL